MISRNVDRMHRRVDTLLPTVAIEHGRTGSRQAPRTTGSYLAFQNLFLKLASQSLFFSLLEIQGDRIDAVTQSSWVGTVRKYVAQMRTATVATDLGTLHTVAVVHLL